MKNIYKNSSLNLARAKKILMKNNIIGLPTETVYGLACESSSKTAIQKVYNLKQRPLFNPLIIIWFSFYHYLYKIETFLFFQFNSLKEFSKLLFE